MQPYLPLLLTIINNLLTIINIGRLEEPGFCVSGSEKLCHTDLA